VLHRGARAHLFLVTSGLEGVAILIGLYKIFVHAEAVVHESIILLLPPPTCIAHTYAILLHDLCAIYDPHPTPFVHAIHHTILAVAISCKDQYLDRNIQKYEHARSS